MDDWEELWVVVVHDGDSQLLMVLGPRRSRLEAQALKEVLRLGPHRKATVHRIRKPDVFDLHGLEVFEELLPDPQRHGR